MLHSAAVGAILAILADTVQNHSELQKMSLFSKLTTKHTTGEFKDNHTTSILTGQFQKTIVRNYPSNVYKKITEHALNILDGLQKVDL